MTSLTPSCLRLARTHLEMERPTEALGIITSTARPEEWKESESARIPPKLLIWGQRAQIARCTFTASRVRPRSILDPDAHLRIDIPPPELVDDELLLVALG